VSNFDGQQGQGQRRFVIDSVDRQIVRELQHDGRTPNVEIARTLGLSEATVRRRLGRLLEAGAIHIQAVPDAAKTGYTTIAFMTLSVDLARAGQIAAEIAQMPEVRTIHLTTGGSELLVQAWFRSNDELLRFMTERIGSIPGITRAATLHVLRTFKDGSDWVLPPGERDG
jgi:Lrp/AsnC family transcriptional regulator for asnA, asnC and gidA